MEEDNNKAEAHTIASAFDEIIDEFKRDDFSVNGLPLQIHMDSAKDICCHCACKDFIKSWQNAYEKSGIPISSFIDKIEPSRAVHTVSCFLLGLWLYQKSSTLSGNIIKQLEPFRKFNMSNKNAEYEEFLFAWMLTCVYHDFGYAYEEGSEAFNDAKTYCQELIDEMFHDHLYIPDFTKEYVNKYREYRQCRFSCKDHGIYGAMKLIKGLRRKRFYNLYKEFYDLAAQTIACHNMYYCVRGEEFEKCYQTKGMTELIRENRDDKRRDYRKHPFLFLLSLVDTIEPTKAFNNYNAIFDIQINLEKEHDGAEKLIVIPQNGSDEEHLNKYKNALHEMDKWLTGVETDKNENGFKISLES